MSTLPKISLDSSSDLAFLRLQLQQALSSRLQTHLPNALPEDSFRTLIESHISAFLSNTMQETTQNITINGMPPRPSDIAKGVQVEAESYETFDVKLQADVLSRHAELEETITRVTRMRREVPEQIKLILASRQDQDPDVKMETGEVDEVDDGTWQGDAEVKIARLDEVQETYAKSVGLLRDMKQSVGSVNAKAQRAKEVLEFIQQQQKESAALT